MKISTENNKVHVNVSNSKYSDNYKTTVDKKKDTFIKKPKKSYDKRSIPKRNKTY